MGTHIAAALAASNRPEPAPRNCVPFEECSYCCSWTPGQVACTRWRHVPEIGCLPQELTNWPSERKRLLSAEPQATISKRPQASQKHQLCPHLPQGRCTHGDSCWYSHSYQEQQASLRNIKASKVCSLVSMYINDDLVQDICTMLYLDIQKFLLALSYRDSPVHTLYPLPGISPCFLKHNVLRSLPWGIQMQSSVCKVATIPVALCIAIPLHP